MNKDELLKRGIWLAERFCARNKLVMPEIRVIPKADWRFQACAYYRPAYIAICVEKCAAEGKAGRSWSWPGYVVDRTPYGVIQHELGHSVDYTFSQSKGAYFGDYSLGMLTATGEPALTGYAPNAAEWFAEIFRLFVTNADLLRRVRPKAFTALASRLTAVVVEPWQDVLSAAPTRTVAMAEKKIRLAA